MGREKAEERDWLPFIPLHVLDLKVWKDKNAWEREVASLSALLHCIFNRFCFTLKDLPRSLISRGRRLRIALDGRYTVAVCLDECTCWCQSLVMSLSTGGIWNSAALGARDSSYWVSHSVGCNRLYLEKYLNVFLWRSSQLAKRGTACPCEAACLLIILEGVFIVL